MLDWVGRREGNASPRSNTKALRLKWQEVSSHHLEVWKIFPRKSKALKEEWISFILGIKWSSVWLVLNEQGRRQGWSWREAELNNLGPLDGMFELFSRAMKNYLSFFLTDCPVLLFLNFGVPVCGPLSPLFYPGSQPRRSHPLPCV